MNIAIGIDIGGTKIAIGLIDENGNIIAKTRLDTDLSIPPTDMTTRIAQSTLAMIEEYGIHSDKIIGVGIGAPGPLDPKNGIITCPPNLPSWSYFPLVQEISRLLPYTIKMENDATAATLAEKWIGAAQDTDHFIFITISTGIGAGIYLHGKLITGATGNAGDAGHIVIDSSAGKCTCGQNGCLEWLASGTAIARQASKLAGKEVTSKEAFDLAANDDLQMQELVNQTFRYIGMGCVSLINLFDPDTIVIGGGVSSVGTPLFESVQAYVGQYALNPSGRNTVIVPAVLNQDAGLIGAAALIHMKY